MSGGSTVADTWAASGSTVGDAGTWVASGSTVGDAGTEYLKSTIDRADQANPEVNCLGRDPGGPSLCRAKLTAA